MIETNPRLPYQIANFPPNWSMISFYIANLFAKLPLENFWTAKNVEIIDKNTIKFKNSEPLYFLSANKDFLRGQNVNPERKYP